MRDADLLSTYARDRSNGAFATLVERHLNLVYSVARRHVRDAAAAEDVAQAVFVELARNASRINPGTPLVAWLHLVARRTALNALRSEVRRHTHEMEAAALETMNPPPPPWTEVEPLLDEAVESLPEKDRAAILLRFFQNKNLREVGAALGLSDDAAQKRVSRALDQLRAFFVRRGIAVSAAGLTATLSAHALEAAPASLSAAITSAATLAGAATAGVTVETAKVIAMTTLQKTAIVAAFVVAGGAGLYEASLIARHASELATVRASADHAARQVREFTQARASAATRLKEIEQQIDARLAAASARPSPAEPALEAKMTEWLNELDRLKQFFAANPSHNIPELRLLDEDEWFNIVARVPSPAALRFRGEPEPPPDLRETAARARMRAENIMANKLGAALSAHVAANDGMLPNEVAELLPYFDPPIDPALLARYEMLHTGKLSERERAAELIAPRAPADVEHDMFVRTGISGMGVASSALHYNASEAQRRFARANGGQRATSAAQLQPYLKWPVNAEALQKILTPSPRAR